MPLFGIDNGRDAAQALGQVGPKVAQGQYRGMQLGQQRARDQGHFQIESQNQQRMLMELQQRISQAQAENQFRIQQLQQQHEAQGEAAKYHEGMLGVASNRLQQAQSKKQGDKWIVAPQGFLLNQTTGETKALPPELGQAGGAGPGMNKFSPVAAINAFNPVVDYGNQHPGMLNSNPTNTAYNPGFASQYSMGTNVQAQMAKMLLQQSQGPGLGQPPSGPAIGQPGPTNQIPGQSAPSVPKFRFNPATGQIEPQ